MTDDRLIELALHRYTHKQRVVAALENHALVLRRYADNTSSDWLRRDLQLVADRCDWLIEDRQVST